MADLDLGTLGRKLLLIAAILSALVIGEMVLVSAEEPAATAQDSPEFARTTPRFLPEGAARVSRVP